MTVYRTRPGVVMASVCGEYVLVAAKAARELVPYTTQLNESSAFLWRKLEQGASEESLEAAVAEEYELQNIEEARTAIRDFLKQMMELGYLVSEDEGGERHE